jgi:L-threonylcarbamoyladenylate synthase
VTTFRWLSPVSPSGLLRLGDAASVAEVLAKGGLAVLPTETGYLLAAAATSEEALLRAFRVKERDLAHPMHVAVASIEMAERYAVLSPAARLIMGAFTPGPLTVVVPQTDALPRTLVTLDGTVGLRVPDHPATLQVVVAAGFPVTATSLNRSGEESRPVSQAVLDSLDWGDLAEVPVVADETSIRHASASTLVRLTDGVEVLRQGPVTADEVEALLARRP